MYLSNKWRVCVVMGNGLELRLEFRNRCGRSHMERGMEARRSRGFYKLLTKQSKENNQEEKSYQWKSKAPERARQLGWGCFGMKVCNLFVLKEKHSLCSLSTATPLCKPFVCERKFVKVMKDKSSRKIYIILNKSIETFRFYDGFLMRRFRR